MHDYCFFLSYARIDRENDRGETIKKFFDDLNPHVKRLAFPDGGFLDTGMREGQFWEAGLENALSRSRILVSLYSTNYFRSEYCGKEWQVFYDRYLHRSQDREAQPAILGIMWDKGLQIPDPAKKLQLGGDGYPKGYFEEGLFALASLGKFKDSYDEFVFHFARTLVDAAKAQGVPVFFPVPSLENIQPAFGRSDHKEPPEQESRNGTSATETLAHPESMNELQVEGRDVGPVVVPQKPTYKVADYVWLGVIALLMILDVYLVPYSFLNGTAFRFLPYILPAAFALVLAVAFGLSPNSLLKLARRKIWRISCIAFAAVLVPFAFDIVDVQPVVFPEGGRRYLEVFVDGQKEPSHAFHMKLRNSSVVLEAPNTEPSPFRLQAFEILRKSKLNSLHLEYKPEWRLVYRVDVLCINSPNCRTPFDIRFILLNGKYDNRSDRLDVEQPVYFSEPTQIPVMLPAGEYKVIFERETKGSESACSDDQLTPISVPHPETYKVQTQKCK